MSRWPNWMRGSLAPDEIIGEHAMLRWHLFGPTSRLAIYLHKHQGDDPRTPHDHPADNISIRLRGTLFEYRPSSSSNMTKHALAVAHRGDRFVAFGLGGIAFENARALPRICFRRAEDAHRLELPKPGATAWSLWIRFRNRRQWGYFEPNGWRPAITARQPPAQSHQPQQGRKSQ
jgi:hypothetical protein